MRKGAACWARARHSTALIKGHRANEHHGARLSVLEQSSDGRRFCPFTCCSLHARGCKVAQSPRRKSSVRFQRLTFTCTSLFPHGWRAGVLWHRAVASGGLCPVAVRWCLAVAGDELQPLGKADSHAVSPCSNRQIGDHYVSSFAAYHRLPAGQTRSKAELGQCGRMQILRPSHRHRHVRRDEQWAASDTLRSGSF